MNSSTTHLPTTETTAPKPGDAETETSESGEAPPASMVAGEVSDVDIASAIRLDTQRARQGLPLLGNDGSSIKRRNNNNEGQEAESVHGNGGGPHHDDTSPTGNAAKRNKREYLAFHGTKHTRVGDDYQVDLSSLPVPEQR